MRIIPVTGKGGVGKTTTAAATALACADAGLATAVISTDPAHSLADSFDAELGDSPIEVAPGLEASQLDAQSRMDESWAEIRDYLRSVFGWAGVDAVEAEEMSVFPGLDEIFALTDIKAYAERDEHDVLVVDGSQGTDMIPFVPEIVTAVDVVAKTVVANWQSAWSAGA